MPGMPCCCGGGPCWEWSDLFSRANSTDVGSDWNEVTGGGDWEILDQELHEKAGGGGTANARIFCTQAVPRRSAGEMMVSVDVCDPQAGDVFFIYPSCPNTSTVGDVSVSFTFDGTSTWNISISAGTGSGTSEQTKTTPLDGKVALYVCCDYSSGSVHAGVEGGISTDPDVGPAWADDAVFSAGRYVALGHNNGAGSTFDNFFLYELRVSATKLCLVCGCDCEGIVPGKTLTGTVTSGTDRAACLEGEDWPMYWEWASGSSFWEGDLYSDVNTPATTITYRLSCDDSDRDSTAWKAPGSVVSGLTGYDEWANPDNAKADDNTFTTASVKDTEPSEFLKCTNFGFVLPDGVTVTGVEVHIQHKCSVNAGCKDYGVYLFNADAAPTGENKALATPWADYETTAAYGGQFDTWKFPLSEAIVEGANFGVIISAVGTSATARVAGIDFVEVKVYYKYYAGYNYKLNISNGACCASNPGGCSAVFRANAGSACNPLSLNFGPFNLSATDLLCAACYDPGLNMMDGTPLDGPMSGEYYITITDPA